MHHRGRQGRRDVNVVATVNLGSRGKEFHPTALNFPKGRRTLNGELVDGEHHF